MKASVVALLACVLVPVLALAQEGQAQGNLNTITSVSVKGGAVEIVGTKKPNFTTFTMTDPPRLVIDISEAVFSGVKENMPVGNGTVTGIRTASYGSDESAIARVLIGYEREVETDIQATGNSLVVNVVGGGGAAVAAKPGTPAGTGTAGTGTATTPGGTAGQAAVAAQADQKQQERAAAQATEAAQADQKQQERAAAQAAADAQAAAEAQRQAQARAEADRKAQEEAARVAAQQAEQQRLQQDRAAKEAAAAAEKQRREDEARAAAEEKKRQQAEAQAAAAASAEEKKRLASEEKTRREEAAQAAAEEKKRLAAESRTRQQEEARAASEERKRQQEEARQSRLAQAETPRRTVEQGDAAGVSSRRKTMTLVGFKQEPTTSRVFVRTNEPVRYTVSEGNKQVVLELENTGISESNNTRSLDTSFFDTAVASVDADAGPSRTVRVAIKLKEQVSYQTRQDGNEVSIEFQRPARR